MPLDELFWYEFEAELKALNITQSSEIDGSLLRGLCELQRRLKKLEKIVEEKIL